MGAYSAEVLSATSWNFININISININIKINGSPTLIRGKKRTVITINSCAADFSLLNLPKGKSLGRSKPATNS